MLLWVSGVPEGSCLGLLLFLLYINDLHTASSFDTTLFADDTFLMMSDRSIKSLQTKSNLKFNKIDACLRQNKLSLNYPKTNFVVINKYPHKSVSASFKLNLNDIALKRVEIIKYLGILIDETLTWFSHITQ